MFPSGKSPLQYARTITSRRWWQAGLHDLRDLIVQSYAARTEITAGGIVSAGAALSTTVMAADVSAIDAVSGGRIAAQLAAVANGDLLSAVGQPIFESGADATSFVTLGVDEAVQCTLILANSDGAGGAITADNGALILIPVFAGVDAATAKAATAPLTSVEIQAALEASVGVHAAVTAWSHVAEIVYGNPAGVPGLIITMNRNNAVSGS